MAAVAGWGPGGDVVTTDASIKVLVRHAIELAAMNEDRHEAVAQLYRSVGDRQALLDAHAHYAAVLNSTPNDDAARRALTLVEWALTSAAAEPGAVRRKKASTAG